MGTYQQIEYETRGRVAIVRLNRPHVFNAQSRVLREEMDAAFDVACADPGIGSIVLMGAGKHFSAGHDIGTAEELADQKARPYAPGPYGEVDRSWDLNCENSLRWRNLPKPTVAMVQGYCMFGGFIIATAMDLIVASDDALFLPWHVQFFSAPWELGTIRQAKRILFENRFVPAEEAFELGLVTEVTTRETLEERTMELAARIAENDPLVLRLTKASINNAQDLMGYTNGIRTAHGNYMHMQIKEAVHAPGAKRLKGVDLALRHKAEDEEKAKRGG
ncbi:MAG: enoyl-CoA hydratase/isomerase family protein [Alphaproteobacteria bacterium]|nr:enoyl-CoA hydratase/isomerase family protein [Alphaproteobacteria bacterium]